MSVCFAQQNKSELPIKKGFESPNPSKVYFTVNGGDEGIRTPDLLHAKQALSQLSYTPTFMGKINGRDSRTRTYDLSHVKRAL